jgi:hypothetical protein
VCVKDTSKTRRLKSATGLWKIQPQWVVTPGKQTNNNVKSVFEVRNGNCPFEINCTFTVKNQLQVTLKFSVDPYLHLQQVVLMPTAAVFVVLLYPLLPAVSRMTVYN